MKTIKNKFKKNGLHYTMINRNDNFAIYGVSGTYTEKITHYEVLEIHHHKQRTLEGRIIEGGEHLPSNEQFGRDKSRAFLSHKDALIYYEKLTTTLQST